jgi:hypothetical protein
MVPAEYTNARKVSGLTSCSSSAYPPSSTTMSTCVRLGERARGAAILQELDGVSFSADELTAGADRVVDALVAFGEPSRIGRWSVSTWRGC